MPQTPGRGKRSLLFVPQGQQAREVQGFRAHMTNSVYYGAITEDQTQVKIIPRGVTYKRLKGHRETTTLPEGHLLRTAPERLKLSWERDPSFDNFLRANFQSRNQYSANKASSYVEIEQECFQDRSDSAPARQQPLNAEQAPAHSPTGLDDTAKQLLQDFISNPEPQSFLSSAWQKRAAVPVVLAYSPALYWCLATVAIAKGADVQSVFKYKSLIISELQRSIDDPSTRYGESVLTGIACLISSQSVQEGPSEQSPSDRGQAEEIKSWEQCIPHAQAFWMVLRDRKHHVSSLSGSIIAPFVNYLMIFAVKGFTCHVRANESDRVLWQPKLALTMQRLRKLQELAKALTDGSSEIRAVLQDVDKNIEGCKSLKAFLTTECEKVADKFYKIFNLCYLSVALIMSVSDGDTKEKAESFFALVTTLNSKFRGLCDSRRLLCDLPGAEDYVSVCITMLHVTALLSETGTSEVLRFFQDLVVSAIDAGPVAKLDETVFAELEALTTEDNP